MERLPFARSHLASQDLFDGELKLICFSNALLLPYGPLCQLLVLASFLASESLWSENK